MEYRYLKGDMRRAGQVIAKICLTQVHRADPQNTVSLVVGAEDWLHDSIWSTTKQNMQFVATYPHWTG
jgi:hypothetical protein